MCKCMRIPHKLNKALGFMFVSDLRVVELSEGVVYLASPGRPTDIGKACYPYSR